MHSSKPPTIEPHPSSETPKSMDANTFEKQHKNRKHTPLLRELCFLLLILLLNEALCFCLMNDSIARIDIHRASVNHYDDLFIGTSHGLSALDPEAFDSETGHTSTNLCMPNERMTDSYYMIRQICRKQTPKRIIYELDPAYWSIPYVNGESTNYIYANMPASLVKLQYAWDKNASRDFRDTLFPWHYYRSNAGSIPHRIEEKLSHGYRSYDITRLSTSVQVYSQEGFLYQTADPDGDKKDPDYTLWDPNTIEERESLYFDKLLNFCQKKGIQLIVVTTPVPRESYEVHRDIYDDAHAYFTAYMAEREVPYYDCNYLSVQEEGYDPTLRGFLDHEGHMLGTQGVAFSHWLGKQMRE